MPIDGYLQIKNDWKYLPVAAQHGAVDIDIPACLNSEPDLGINIKRNNWNEIKLPFRDWHKRNIKCGETVHFNVQSKLPNETVGHCPMTTLWIMMLTLALNRDSDHK
ncbi:3199_t:CDS:2 [Entrophospora sp. SA101]|nr:3199_t:CDS:2 [Entrophospora sp. SA101]